jgi:carbonic anhydrase/acetyltransferase-like protein (isoleucine patch superfamily)
MHPLWRNPLTDYARFVANWMASKRRHPRLHQHYMALAIESTFEPHVTLLESALVVRSELGSHSYVGAGSVIHRTHMGRFCSIGPGCRFGGGRHPTDFVSTHPIFYSPNPFTGVSFADRSYFDEYADIHIGHDVWIGANAIVLDGVEIGDGAIIAAGAVVTSDVDPYAIVGGVPAKRIRFRFDEATVAALRASRWWERNPDWLRAHVHLFHDPRAFLAQLAATPSARSA